MRIKSKKLAIAGAALAFAIAAHAKASEFKVFMPDAEPGETEFETIGEYGADANRAHAGELGLVEELEMGVNNFWRTGFELEQERDAGLGEPLRFNEISWENVLQFTQRGEYWLDSGFFFEFTKTRLMDQPNEVKFGPIFRKEIFGTINTVNLFLKKEVGDNAVGRPAFEYNWETRIALGTPIEPGIQAYGRPSDFAGFGSGWPQDNRIGPQLFGNVATLGPGSLKWNAGLLFGLTSASPRVTVRWQAEYEIHF